MKLFVTTPKADVSVILSRNEEKDSSRYGRKAQLTPETFKMINCCFFVDVIFLNYHKIASLSGLQIWFPTDDLHCGLGRLASEGEWLQLLL